MIHLLARRGPRCHDKTIYPGAQTERRGDGGPVRRPLAAGPPAGSRTISPSAKTKWAPYGKGLPNVQVFDLRYDSTDNVLVAGTFGRGAWTVSDFTNTLPHAHR
jgi:hypothetical protein